jgi:hypothetical protein
MEDELGEGIYRAMVEENGMPKLGASATTLGIRRGIDIVPDPSGMVQRPLFQPGAPNGLSCSPTIQSLPAFALPVAWGGRNAKTAVWRIEQADLGSDLVAQEDTLPGKRRHISIGPARTMLADEFAQAVERTRPKWKKVIKN